MQPELPKPGPPREAPESIWEFFVDNWFFVIAVAIIIYIVMRYSRALRERKNK